MKNDTSAEMLFAQLELRAPGVSHVLISSPRSGPDCLAVSRGMGRAAERFGRASRLVRLGEEATPAGRGRAPGEVDGRVPEVAIDVADLRHPRRSRALLCEFDGLSIVVGAGILDDPATVLAIRVVECVVVVSQAGKTLRADLERARVEVEQAGGQVLGAVLVR